MVGIIEKGKFLEESNRIEGEYWEHLPKKAIDYALAQRAMTPFHIVRIHELHEEGFTLFHGGRSPIKFGEWRDHDVCVGSWVAPPYKKIGKLMTDYCMDWNKMDAWEAHCRFEAIHPFPDLNGRVGRLLWLIKAVQEGYDGSIPFLQKFYYQTLNKYESNKAR